MFDNPLCRLCKSTRNIRTAIQDDSTDFHLIINFCVNIKMEPDDGLPTMICKKCRNRVIKFYHFKSKCLEVDNELKAMKQSYEIQKQMENNMIQLDCITDCVENILDDSYMLDETRFDHSDIETELFNFVEENSFKLEHDEALENPVQCEHCGGMFKTKTEYKIHLSTHRETQLFQCTLCPKKFKRAESKRNHMRSHLGIKPFICDMCGQSCTKKQDLTRHMKIHKNEWHFECQMCGRRFKRSGDLRTHVRTHSGARPYKCKYCDKDYTSHSGLRKHAKRHGEKSG